MWLFLALFSSFHKQPHKAAIIFVKPAPEHSSFPPSKALFALIAPRSNFFLHEGSSEKTEQLLDWNA